jgi:hypothetical protein
MCGYTRTEVEYWYGVERLTGRPKQLPVVEEGKIAIKNVVPLLQFLNHDCLVWDSL